MENARTRCLVLIVSDPLELTSKTTLAGYLIIIYKTHFVNELLLWHPFPSLRISLKYIHEVRKCVIVQKIRQVSTGIYLRM